MNQFGDLSSHEFVSIMNGFRPRSEEKMMNGSCFSVSANFGSLPASFDWSQEPGKLWFLLGLLRYRGSGGRSLQEDWETRESLGTTADRLQWRGLRWRLAGG